MSIVTKELARVLVISLVGLPLACTNSNSPTKRFIKSIDRGGQDSSGNGGGSSGSGDGGIDNSASRAGLKAPEVAHYNLKEANGRFEDIVEASESDKPCSMAKQNPSVRIKTNSEYRNTINYVFGVDLDEGHIDVQRLPKETTGAGFTHLRDFNVMSVEKIEAFIDAAEDISYNKDVIKQTSEAMKCGDGSEKCFKKWAEKTLSLLWRSELSSDDIKSEYQMLKNFGGDDEAVRSYLQRVLISPRFLYNTKVGSKETSKLTSWEIASILSNTLWNGQLDDDLVEAAKDDRLQGKDDVEKMVKRMIEDEKFYDGLKYFTYSWLSLDHLESRSINITENTVLEDSDKNLLFDESPSFLLHLMRADDDSISNIFNSDFTFLSKNLQKQFLVEASSENVTRAKGIPKEMELSVFSDSRRGILSHTSVLSAMSNDTYTNISKRGKLLMENFLCEGLALPEELGDDAANAKYEDDIPRIDALNKLTSKGICAACHNKINGPGAALEALSEIGLPRKLDLHKKRTEGAGSVTIDGKKEDVTGVKELAKTISKSPRAGICLTLKVFRLLYERVETEEDSCTITSAYKNAKKNDTKLQSIFSSLLTDPNMISVKKP